jgi:hypothetical protein
MVTTYHVKMLFNGCELFVRNMSEVKGTYGWTGRCRVKTLPCPKVLSTVTQPS